LRVPSVTTKGSLSARDTCNPLPVESSTLALPAGGIPAGDTEGIGAIEAGTVVVVVTTGVVVVVITVTESRSTEIGEAAEDVSGDRTNEATLCALQYPPATLLS
jgi:hypothetical protein